MFNNSIIQTVSSGYFGNVIIIYAYKLNVCEVLCFSEKITYQNAWDIAILVFKNTFFKTTRYNLKSYAKLHSIF